MGEEEMLLLQYLLQTVPGKTAAQRLNFLQDIGFSPFGDGRDFVEQQFVGEQFVGDPAPYLRNPVFDMYGRDAGYQKVFDNITRGGMAPDAAVQAAIDEGLLDEPSQFDNRLPNPYEIARQYAEREIDNEMQLAGWEQKTAAEREQFMAKQARLGQEFAQKQDLARAEFERNRPFTLADLRGTTEFEAAGMPTVDELLELSAQQRASWAPQAKPAEGSMENMLRMYGERVPRAAGAVAPAPAPVEPRLSQQDIFKNQKYAGALRREFGKRVTQAQQTYLPTERSQNALQRIALMRALGG